MNHLSDEQIAELRKQLEHRLASLADYQMDIDESDPARDMNRGEYNESGEDAIENYEMLEADSLSSAAGEMIAEIKAALDRMGEGTYGLDEETGEPIPFARLQLLPEARTNVENAHDDEDDE
ncbi:TraR/DksA family transcriptional regulator [Candidatus Woesebacteria bacterium]|nr:TraR/DksA family transcriptional regulator [Candidatus Woesebacteria bacterium]MCD8507357.1 TraR/DksA family transcriptional regulator [Candidatus Woesebacteria bacterium]MCD8527174.1 TraR/DksA family transcriptional regulator [Candidatus Woesebacteria bacterium]MCD8546790.1 TraR/DksA family transcriptional regulator [Candidatus Woesebacteria bacterium]